MEEKKNWVVGLKEEGLKLYLNRNDENPNERKSEKYKTIKEIKFATKENNTIKPYLSIENCFILGGKVSSIECMKINYYYSLVVSMSSDITKLRVENINGNLYCVNIEAEVENYKELGRYVCIECRQLHNLKVTILGFLVPQPLKFYKSKKAWAASVILRANAIAKYTSNRKRPKCHIQFYLDEVNILNSRGLNISDAPIPLPIKRPSYSSDILNDEVFENIFDEEGLDSKLYQEPIFWSQEKEINLKLLLSIRSCTSPILEFILDFTNKNNIAIREVAFSTKSLTTPTRLLEIPNCFILGLKVPWLKNVKFLERYNEEEGVLVVSIPKNIADFKVTDEAANVFVVQSLGAIKNYKNLGSYSMVEVNLGRDLQRYFKGDPLQDLCNIHESAKVWEASLIVEAYTTLNKNVSQPYFNSLKFRVMQIHITTEKKLKSIDAPIPRS